jgi:hypothetical protein
MTAQSTKMADDLTKYVYCKACSIKTDYHAMEEKKKVTYYDTRMILIPTVRETEWAKCNNTIQR